MLSATEGEGCPALLLLDLDGASRVGPALDADAEATPTSPIEELLVAACVMYPRLAPGDEDRNEDKLAGEELSIIVLEESTTPPDVIQNNEI